MRCSYHRLGYGNWINSIACPACRRESIQRTRSGRIGFYTLREILEYEADVPVDQRVLSRNAPPSAILQALKAACGEDLGRAQYHRLILWLCDLAEERGKPIPSETRRFLLAVGREEFKEKED